MSKKLNLDGVTTLIFDLGGVLINLDRDACVKAYVKAGVNNADTLLGVYSQAGIFHNLESGKISPKEFYDGLRELSGKDISDEVLLAAFREFLLDLPNEKKDLLLELNKSYDVYMLSNTNILHFPWIAKEYFDYKGYSLNDFFKKCFLSYEIGSVKPENKIFEHVLTELDRPASECLFFDDGPANIEAAKALGFKTYLVAPHEDLRPLF